MGEAKDACIDLSWILRQRGGKDRLLTLLAGMILQGERKGEIATGLSPKLEKKLHLL